MFQIIASNFLLAFQVSAALGQISCVDLSQTQCGKYGISFKYPGAEGSDYANVTAIDAYLNSLYSQNSAYLNNLCGTSNIDVTKINGYQEDFCYTTWNSVAAQFNALNNTGALSCNNNQQIPFKNICQADCIKALSVLPDYLKSVGCKDQSSTVANSTFYNEVCANSPTTNCQSIQFSSASSVAMNLLPALMAGMIVLMM